MPLVSGGILHNPARWRAFADAVAAALGVNVWVSIVLLPGVFVGAFDTGGAQLAAAIPLFVLFVGLWRRSDAVLLLGVPSALLVPIALRPELVARHVYGPGRFALVAIGLVGYLLGASFLSSWREPAPPERVRALASAAAPTPERWKRRRRMYLGLTVLSAVIPACLIYAANFDGASQKFMQTLYPGRVATMTTMINVLIIALWIGLYIHAFLGVLRPHRVGDRDLAVQLAMTRSAARRGKPRPLFYVAVAAALVFMVLLVAYRYG